MGFDRRMDCMMGAGAERLLYADDSALRPSSVDVDEEYYTSVVYGD